MFTELKDHFRAPRKTPLIQKSVSTACSTSWKERESVLIMEKTGTIKKPRTRDFKEVLRSKIKLQIRHESPELLCILLRSLKSKMADLILL